MGLGMCVEVNACLLLVCKGCVAWREWFELGNPMVPSLVGGAVVRDETAPSPSWGVLLDHLSLALEDSRAWNWTAGSARASGAALQLSSPGPPDRHTARAPAAGG